MKNENAAMLLELGYQEGLLETLSNEGLPVSMREHRRSLEILVKVEGSATPSLPEVSACICRIRKLLGTDRKC